jgi:membrane fusion protein (multidrug efflux system)
MSSLLQKDPETQGGGSGATPDAAASTTAPSTPPPSATKGRGKAFVIFFVILAVLGVAGTFYWMHERQFESTDDAQVDGHLNAISSRVEGSVIKVYVDDNQVVKAGDPLVDLDPRDYQVAVDQAEAQLAQAQSTVTAQQPNVPITQVQNSTNISGGEADLVNAQAALSTAEHDVDTAKARLEEAQANNEKAQSDLQRYQTLVAKEEVSKQEFDGVASSAKAQAAAVAAAQSTVQADLQIVNQKRALVTQAQSRLQQYQRNAPAQLEAKRAAVVSDQAAAKTAEARLERAKLDLDYTKITAPIGGIVLKRSAEVGQHVAAGQQLVTIAQTDDLWVTANFKETQLRSIHPKQSVVIHVDALNKDFQGYVDDVGGATGAITSVLPPENATGNFVKVVQRIPVRIRFNKNQDGLDRLRPGMSVEPDVRVMN